MKVWEPRWLSPRCACGATRCNYLVYNAQGRHSQQVCYPLHGWCEDPDSWYARECERMAERAPA